MMRGSGPGGLGTQRLNRPSGGMANTRWGCRRLGYRGLMETMGFPQAADLFPLVTRKLARCFFVVCSLPWRGQPSFRGARGRDFTRRCPWVAGSTRCAVACSALPAGIVPLLTFLLKPTPPAQNPPCVWRAPTHSGGRVRAPPLARSPSPSPGPVVTPPGGSRSRSMLRDFTGQTALHRLARRGGAVGATGQAQIRACMHALLGDGPGQIDVNAKDRGERASCTASSSLAFGLIADSPQHHLANAKSTR